MNQRTNECKRGYQTLDGVWVPPWLSEAEARRARREYAIEAGVRGSPEYGRSPASPVPPINGPREITEKVRLPRGMDGEGQGDQNAE